jgi:hypothetical protein
MLSSSSQISSPNNFFIILFIYLVLGESYAHKALADAEVTFFFFFFFFSFLFLFIFFVGVVLLQTQINAKLFHFF